MVICLFVYILLCLILVVELFKLQIILKPKLKKHFNFKRRYFLKSYKKYNKSIVKCFANFKCFKIYVNNKIVKNFKQAFFGCGVIFYCIFCYGVLLIKVVENNVVVLNNFNQEKVLKVVCFRYVKNPKIKLIKGETDLKINQKIYCNIQNFKVVNFFNFSSNNNKVQFKINSVSEGAMQMPIFGFNSYDYTCLNNTNKKQFVKDFLFNFKSFKVVTKNGFINNLINNFLPCRVESCLKNYNNQNHKIFNKIITEYNTNFVVDFLLKQKKYLELFNYILCNVLGVLFFNDCLVFLNNSNYLSKFKIEYKGAEFWVNNSNIGTSVLYNGIVYNNISVIKLQSINSIKFDKLKLM